MKIKNLTNLQAKIPNRILFIVLLLLPFLQSNSNAKKDVAPPPGSEPLEVSVILRINKIYNINSVNETYQMDGYLTYTWVDKRVGFKPEDSLVKSIIYENERTI